MRRPFIIYILAAVFALNQSCEKQRTHDSFLDQLSLSIYDYMVENESQFSSFLTILEADSLDKTLSALNPNGSGYTLFLPTNEAIDNYFNSNGTYSSLIDLLNDRQSLSEIARNHIVPELIPSRDFPFGAFEEDNLSGNRLSVGVVLNPDSAYYKINNQAILKKDIELSNGCIHILGGILTPITYSNHDWLLQDAGLAIFKSLIDTTGLDNVIDKKTSTLLVEPDTVYNKFNIFSLEDLIAKISPENDNYTAEWNPLNYYANYHILKKKLFINDFTDNQLDDYKTFTDERIVMDGSGIDIEINPGAEFFDTIIKQGDTTTVDFVGFIYDECNVVTRNGTVHFINWILKPKLSPEEPSRKNRWFEFYEELLIWEFEQAEGEYLIEDTSFLDLISWSGTDLHYIKSNSGESPARNRDFLLLDGDFHISYNLPEIDTGKYIMYLGAEAFSETNATIEVYLDGIHFGSTINLRSGGTEKKPFVAIELGEVDIQSSEDHIVEIESSVPGRFFWDYFRFKPI